MAKNTFSQEIFSPGLRNHKTTIRLTFSESAFKIGSRLAVWKSSDFDSYRPKVKVALLASEPVKGDERRKFVSFTAGVFFAFPQVTAERVGVAGFGTESRSLAWIKPDQLKMWKARQSRRRQKTLEGVRVAAQARLAHKDLSVLTPFEGVKRWKGYIGIDIFQISSQIKSDAAFAGVSSLLSDIISGKRGNYWIRGLDRLPAQRQVQFRLSAEKVLGVRLVYEQRGILNKEIVTWVDFTNTLTPSENQLSVKVRGFDAARLANMETGIVLAQLASDIYSNHPQSQREELLKTIQFSPMAKIIARYSEGGVEPSASDLDEYLRGARLHPEYILRPLVSYLSDLKRAIAAARNIDFSA